ncbi:DJ-1 family glyoxalase III [Mesoplasma lactucae]|uniref:Protease n=1 Tax=Mesoplasma lactucae ATCC 49193 TaxID=81460 RepID=A0A291IRL9_9MOLU|nr:DJ-1 family glyoxalase III [Mesoplasma lactucae]ATG97347.1 protease [Mesoplasma lactucae ATCC 49193]ATZ20201.1 4-methyl-5(b-hydroxyethyl)-thiazole monophosphate biosynthesis [Mesoplasma lactucae ATCC 49193]MCL8216950.1 Protein/nucleic acid deglycase 3 [Mesoplasma lactucae ATCC 49193]
MTKRLAMIVGNNFEEIEMITTVDVVRRGGIEVDIVSLYDQDVMTGAHKIKVVPDVMFKDFNADLYDAISMPGGAGVDSGELPLLGSKELVNLVGQFNKDKKMVGAICAAPQVLGKAGVLSGKFITHYPGCDKYLEGSKSDISARAVVDGNIITGNGPAGAMDFGLDIVGYLAGDEKKKEVANKLLWD